MPEVTLSPSEKMVRSFIQHYHHERYWRYRDIVLNYTPTSTLCGKIHKLRCNLLLLYIKSCDAKNGASFGTHLGFGAEFASPPQLPHGLNGIIISHNAKIGKDVTIYHQVTIGQGRNGAPKIGNNVFIGAGAKIIGNVTIGDNARIGAGCIVTKDVPANATAVMDAPRIILRGNDR